MTPTERAKSIRKALWLDQHDEALRLWLEDPIGLRCLGLKVGVLDLYQMQIEDPQEEVEA